MMVSREKEGRRGRARSKGYGGSNIFDDRRDLTLSGGHAMQHTDDVL